MSRKSMKSRSIKVLSLCLAAFICLFSFAGCADKDGVADTTKQEQTTTKVPDTKEESSVSLTVKDAYNPIRVTLSGSEQLDSCTATLSSKGVCNENGQLISEATSFSDLDGIFEGNFSVHGYGVKEATYTFEVSAQEFDPVFCGVNYYNCIMEAGAKDCRTILVRYCDCVELCDVQGDFEIRIFVYGENCSMQFGCPKLIVKGSVAERCNISLTYHNGTFHFASDSTITDCCVQTVNADLSSCEYQSETENTEYLIDLSDEQVITGKRGEETN